MAGFGLGFIVGLLSTSFFGEQPRTSEPAAAKPKMNVTIGPARILPAKGKVKVNVGPAVIKPAAAKTIQVVSPSHPSETNAVEHITAAKAGIPIPDLVSARKSAQPVADMVRTKGKKYDHAKVRAWQLLAGLPADGLYGPKTAAQLRALGAKNVVTLQR